MSQPRRIWDDALEKCHGEGRCRVCSRSDRKLECAHVSGRAFDVPKEGQKTRWVNPDDVIPLCGSDTTGPGCHQLFDSHQLDILAFLLPHEQVRAVQNFQSIETARRRLCPGDFK